MHLLSPLAHLYTNILGCRCKDKMSFLFLITNLLSVTVFSEVGDVNVLSQYCNVGDRTALLMTLDQVTIAHAQKQVRLVTIPTKPLNTTYARLL